MNLRDFKIGFRHLIQEPAYSAVVILGLGVGFAACILLLSFVRYSFNYNAQIPDARNVYVLKQQFNLDPRAPWFEIGPLGLVEIARKNPAVLEVTAIARVNNYAVKIGSETRHEELMHVLPHFAQMLGIKALDGDLELALTRPEGLALAHSTAEKWFGTAKAVGKSALVDGHLLQVLAIIPDSPSNTTTPYTALVGVASQLMSEADRAGLTDIESPWGRILIRLKPGNSPASVAQSLQQAVDNAPMAKKVAQEKREQLAGHKVMEIRLSPVLDSYFDRDVVGQPFSGPRGDRNSILGLALVAVLILALAAINYVNLATVRVLHRQREVAMRKLLGASVQRVILQFMAESILLSLLATTLGLVLGWLFLPLFSALVDRRLGSIFSVENLEMSLILGVLVGVLASVQPAWIALRIAAAKALAGRSDTESPRAAGLRWCLTVLQFATAVGLAGVTLVIAYQTYFAGHAYPGFDAKPLLVLDSHTANQPENEPDERAFRDALTRLPGVSGLAAAGEAIGRHTSMGLANLSRAGKPRIDMQANMVSANFFDVYRIHPLAGRLFDMQLDAADNATVIVLNMAAVRELGYTSAQEAVGQTLSETNGRNGSIRQFTVVGIAPDIQHQSLREAPRSTLYFPSNNLSVLTLRVAQGMSEVERAVEALWHQTRPNEELSMHRAESFFAPNYAEDQQLANLLAAATGIALTIAGFGIYVLSAYSVRRKEREIVLRKLHGARHSDVAKMVLADSLSVIVAGTLIGLPIAFVAAQRYLASFVQQAPLAIWITGAAAMCAALLVLFASARHTLAAIRIAPNQVLRHE